MFSSNSSKNTIKQGAFERIIPNRLLRSWLIFFAGIGFGLMFFVLFFSEIKSEKPEISDLAGSMYSNNSSTSNLEIDLEEVNASIATGFLQDEYLQTIIEVESVDLVNLSFEFSTSDFSVASLRPMDQSGNSSINGGPGFVNISNEGNGKYVFLLKSLNHLANRIDIKIYSDNRIIYGNSIQTGS